MNSRRVIIVSSGMAELAAVIISEVAMGAAAKDVMVLSAAARRDAFEDGSEGYACLATIRSEAIDGSGNVVSYTNLSRHENRIDCGRVPSFVTWGLKNYFMNLRFAGAQSNTLET